MEARLALIGDSNMYRLWRLWEAAYPRAITSVHIRFFGHPGANLNGDIFCNRWLGDIVDFAPHRAFIWIGGNDLSQYVRGVPFAYDR